MPQKTKALASSILPPAFVDVENLKECLRMIEAGCDYLDSLITGENINDDDNPFPQAVCSYRNNALERFAKLREFLNSGAVVLNPKHPAYAEMYNAVCRIAQEAQHRHFDSAPKPQPARSPLLLVPTPPGEGPVN